MDLEDFPTPTHAFADYLKRVSNQMTMRRSIVHPLVMTTEEVFRF